MIIPNKIKKALTEFTNRFNNDEYIITGGIADYFIFKKYDINLIINDIDIIIFDEDIINDINDIMYGICRLVSEENDFNYKQYFIHSRKYECNIDVFVKIDDNKNKVNMVKLGNKLIPIIDIQERKNEMSIKIDNLSSTDKKLLKYIKKRMIYNNILNNET